VWAVPHSAQPTRKPSRTSDEKKTFLRASRSAANVSTIDAASPENVASRACVHRTVGVDLLPGLLVINDRQSTIAQTLPATM
jgi:hypothetical protein